MKKSIIKLSAILALGISALGIRGCCAEEFFNLSVNTTKLLIATETENPVPFEVVIQSLTAFCHCLKENGGNTSGGTVQVSAKKTGGGSNPAIWSKDISLKGLKPGVPEYSNICSDADPFLVETEISGSSSSNKLEIKSEPFFIQIDGNLSRGSPDASMFQR